MDRSQCETQSTEEREDCDGSNESAVDGADRDGAAGGPESPPIAPRDPGTKA